MSASNLKIGDEVSYCWGDNKVIWHGYYAGSGRVTPYWNFHNPQFPQSFEPPNVWKRETECSADSGQ